MTEFTMYKSDWQVFVFTTTMSDTTKQNSRVRVLFHTLGMSSLGGAIFLQILVFADIVNRGYFMAVENNPGILSLEILLTVFSFIYFVYIYQRFIRSARWNS